MEWKQTCKKARAVFCDGFRHRAGGRVYVQGMAFSIRPSRTKKGLKDCKAVYLFSYARRIASNRPQGGQGP